MTPEQWVLVGLCFLAGFLAMGWAHEYVKRVAAEASVEYLMGGEAYEDEDHPA